MNKKNKPGKPEPPKFNLNSNIPPIVMQQQQQAINYQQVPQQVPIQPNNNLFTNAQQQLSNAQQQQYINLQQQAPIQQVPQRSMAGVYGSRRNNLNSVFKN